MSTNYVTLVNNAISEAGVDLASFASNGSDFTSALVDPMMRRFKTWVSRAWKEIQMAAMDWEFMDEQGLVTIDPGIMFYTDGTAVSPAFVDNLTNATTSIYDQDGSVAVASVQFGDLVDLTGNSTLTAPFFYVNIANTSLTNNVSFGLKPAAEYVTCNSYAVADTAILVGSLPLDTGTWNFVYQTTDSVVHTITDCIYSVTWNNVTGALAFTTYNYTVLQALSGSLATLDMKIQNSAATQSFVVTTSATVTTGVAHKAFVHSWKSFDFTEETGDRDFVENIQEINQKSFRLVDYFAAAPQGEKRLTFIPWEQFRNTYDISSVPPSEPKLITEDDTGRWRFFPHPSRTYGLKFEYIRKPQILSAYNDVPDNLSDEYMDLIMWRAVMYYGEFDEQPNVYARAMKNYKTLLSRFELQYREKFHFKPARLY